MRRYFFAINLIALSICPALGHVSAAGTQARTDVGSSPAPSQESALILLLSFADGSSSRSEQTRIASLEASGLSRAQAAVVIQKANTFREVYDSLQARIKKVKDATTARPYPPESIAQFDEISQQGWKAVSDCMATLTAELGLSGTRALYSYVASKIQPNITVKPGK